MRPAIVALSSLLIIASPVVVPALYAQSAPPLPSGLTRGATHETVTADIPGLTAATSGCPIADDATYGATPANPIKVGGGPIYVASRTMRFLQSLRGPAGEGLHLKRLGSFDGPDDTVLDVYQVEYGSTVRHLYVDGYRSAEVRAPAGLVCGRSASAGPHGADRFETR